MMMAVLQRPRPLYALEGKKAASLWGAYRLPFIFSLQPGIVVGAHHASPVAIYIIQLMGRGGEDPTGEEEGGTDIFGRGKGASNWLCTECRSVETTV